MKSKILRKLCVYAVSASMMLPAAVPVIYLRRKTPMLASGMKAA